MFGKYKKQRIKVKLKDIQFKIIDSSLDVKLQNHFYKIEFIPKSQT